ncbi:MAG: DNA internalization-related competence protein ComEC/Rec2 [Candidatus Cloacimonetes bacterium]|nr:DNA internalization-related competence protein ComEC/Rec2 [Candidatus Cloacimonadota bacterium]
MNEAIPKYRLKSGNNYLPVPALIWVPPWLLGIIFTIYQSNYILLLLLASLSFLLFFNLKTRLISIVILSFIAGSLYTLNHQKKSFNHISNYLSYKYELIDTLATKDYISQQITGKIVSHKHITQNSNRYILKLNTIANIPIAGQIYLYTKENLNYGDKIQTVAKIQPFKITNPGQIDFNKINSRADIYAQAIHLSPIIFLGNSSSGFKKMIYQFRDFINNKIDKTLDYSAPLAKTLILGERSYLNQYNKDYRTEILPDSGLSHLFAVSGLHIGVIMLFSFYILRFLRFNNILSKAITLIILVCYAFICNGSTTITRAVLFFSIFFIANSSSRLISDWQVYLISLFFITLVNPLLLFNPGLQFSYVAIGAIFISKAMLRKMKITISLRIIVKYVLTIFIINILLSPLLIYYFQTINFNTLISNILGIPFISIIMPLFILIIILPPLNILTLSAEFLTELFNYSILFLSSLPFKYSISFSLNHLILIFICLCIAIVIVAYFKKKRRYSLIFVFLIILIISIPSTRHVFKVIFFNVGKADCCLIEFSKRDLLLIDTGDFEDKPNNISYNLIPYLNQNNYRKISKVILTHQHTDHYGGIFKLSKTTKIDTVFITQNFLNSPTGNELINYPSLKSTYFYVVSDTLTLKYSNYKIKFIHPDKDYQSENENNNSLVCQIDFKNLKFLFTGDIEKEAEKYIVNNYSQNLNASILKIPHHGSQTSSSTDFISNINPQYCIISSNNQPGFPNDKTIETINKYCQNHYTTNKDGAIVISQKQDNIFLLKTYLTNINKLIYLNVVE